MTTARKRRGRASELLVAEWFQERGWPDAQAVPPSRPGRDIKGVPGFAPEVKARKGFNPMDWIRQARKNAGEDTPFVVMRPNGLGEESLGEWVVIMRLADFTRLIGGLEEHDPNCVPCKLNERDRVKI